MSGIKNIMGITNLIIKKINKIMNVNKDFEFVLRVLNSSKNIEHIKISDNLFENFKNKCKKKIKNCDFVDYISKYKVDRKKIYEIYYHI